MSVDSVGSGITPLAAAANQKLAPEPAPNVETVGQAAATTETAANRTPSRVVSPLAEVGAVSDEALNHMVEQLNEMMKSSSRAISFTIDRESEQTVIQVKNAETDEIIRQIPNEDALKLAEYLDGMLGLIFNEQA